MSPEDYLLFRTKQEAQRAADRKRQENMARLRADRNRPRPPVQRQLQHVREARRILEQARQA